MRGTLQMEFRLIRHLGIIPAYAGNTASLRSQSARTEDHPRVCGEHTLRQYGHVFGRGSSPRMRGTLRLPAVAVFDHGIIPAYAGNTLPVFHSTPSGRDHPRVCGEHSSSPWMLSEATGSSPRMRGTQRLGDGAYLADGIIPAYAGNTSHHMLPNRL